ncbi:hypothetical protein SAMN04487926_12274 [Paraburkholderia steynii]|uniref:Uncharacterized protein n=1 Tax=Paraburkholderia steynii TaxID=1245441 RepID=A0A7Z7FJZ4_9BURK|nr:hypothetical protein [Paraburkholderia steynii]SDI70948.1 hypothetical protein SAMN04487926_12274 [Paraburkholderia steynii]
MQTERYKGFDLWGHAIEQQRDSSEKACYGASGTVTRAGKLAAASDMLDVVETDEAAQQLGLEWARAWVDSHG